MFQFHYHPVRFPQDQSVPTAIAPIPSVTLAVARQSRSQLGAASVLATQIRGAVCSVGGGDFSLEVEGDGDDDDGT